MVPSGIKIGKEQLNVLTHAADIALIEKNEIETRKCFVEMEHCQKVRTTNIPRKDKIYDSGREKQCKEK